MTHIFCGRLCFKQFFLLILTLVVTVRFQGFKNDLKLAMDQVDQEYLQEILKSGGETSEHDLKNDVKVIEDGTTYEDILVSFGYCGNTRHPHVAITRHYQPRPLIPIPPGGGSTLDLPPPLTPWSTCPLDHGPADLNPRQTVGHLN